jgi:acid phosphatase/lysosomal acid phosphatase/prostatic aicd phosphatase
MTHFRHGARASIFDGEHDFMKEYWKIPEELTGVGQRMHYLLGLRNRERYISNTYPGFLSDKFDPHEILIYSSSLNRTMVSVSSQLQGLYPEGTGLELFSNQTKDAVPRVNLSDYVKQKQLELGLNALPHQISLSPVRMISPLEKKIIIYDIPTCLFRRDEWREKNYKDLKSLQDIVKEFEDKYLDKLKPIYDEYKKPYDIHFIDNFCDGFIAGYTEGREMKKIMDTGIDRKNMSDYCFEFSKLNFRDWISGDKNRTLATLEVSKLMREFIHYAKERIDIDKNNKTEEVKAFKKDYSKPKMMMISAHDSTVSTLEMFFAKIFADNNESFYRYPYFATQVALEVVIDKSIAQDKIKDLDYKIKYYFNDELVFTKNMSDFISAVEPALWTDKYIDEYCNFTQPEPEKKKDAFFYLTIAFSCTTGLLLIALIIVIVKCKKNSSSSETINSKGLLLKNYDGNN